MFCWDFPRIITVSTICCLVLAFLISSCNKITFLNFREEYLAKIQKRVDSYKIEELNPPREGKKLLVLDIDYTLFGKLNNNVLFNPLSAKNLFYLYV